MLRTSVSRRASPVSMTTGIAASAGRRLEPLGEGDAVAAGQHDVHQDEVGADARGCARSRRRRRSRRRGRPALARASPRRARARTSSSSTTKTSGRRGAPRRTAVRAAPARRRREPRREADAGREAMRSATAGAGKCCDVVVDQAVAAPGAPRRPCSPRRRARRATGGAVVPARGSRSAGRRARPLAAIEPNARTIDVRRGAAAPACRMVGLQCRCGRPPRETRRRGGRRRRAPTSSPSATTRTRHGSAGGIVSVRILFGAAACARRRPRA